MVRLKSLRIDRFRTVKRGTVLAFGDTFNVALGKNASGKTTLLDLVNAVYRDRLVQYQDERGGYDLTWTLSDPSGADATIHVDRKADRSLEPRRDGRARFTEEWTMVVRLGDGPSATFKVANGRCGVTLDGDADVELGSVSAFAGPSALIDIALAAQAHALPELQQRVLPFARALQYRPPLRRFDEALRMFDDIWHQTHVTVESSGTSQMITWDSPGTVEDLVNLVHGRRGRGPDDAAGAEADTQKPSDTFALDHMPSLRDVPRCLGLASGELRLRLAEEEREGDIVRRIYEGLDAIFVRRDGTQLTHDYLSFGQKRYFAFLWYLAVIGDSAVVADELLNGLHHAWIDDCVARLQDRQSFLATQHPSLLDHIPIESAESVKTTFMRCKSEPTEDGREQLVWRNFNDEEAERFYRAHITGVQHVSEILRMEGLW